MIIFDEYANLDEKFMKQLEKIEIPNWPGGVIDYGFQEDYKCKFKKEKKMSRKATHEDVQEALEAFATELGLDYSTCREELNASKINAEFLPEVKQDVVVEVTKETKDKPKNGTEIWRDYMWDSSNSRFFPSYRQIKEPVQEATLLGKVNAIAEFLGVDFEVHPEHVVATKVKAVKKTTPKKSKVVAKKGKK